MTIAELLQALVETEEAKEKMALLEENMELIESIKDYDPNTTGSELEDVNTKLTEMTEKHDTLLEKYRESFWSTLKGGEGAKGQKSTGEVDDGTDVGAEDTEVQTLEDLTLSFD